MSNEGAERERPPWRERVARERYDSVVVGSGPNGLAAALTLARAGRSVLVLEARDAAGGGLRSAELTLPGFLHDVCSAIHPLALGSPFFRSLGELPVEWVHPPLAVAHPLDDGSAAVLDRSVEATAEGLGADGGAWKRLFGWIARDWDAIAPDLLGPMLGLPRRPLKLLRFGVLGLRSARGLAEDRFRSAPARALFVGLAAHSVLPLEQVGTGGFGLVLGALGHAVGWPFPRHGSQRLADAMVERLRTLGGEVVTGARVSSLDELPPADAVLLDVTARQALRLAGARFPARYRRSLERFRYGPAVFKLDLALEGPVPWRAEACRRAGTVHVGGTLEEIAASESAVASGRLPQRPYVIVAQQSLFDATRAPAGKHTLWAYCHLPAGSSQDATEPILGQIERFAPGFRALILKRSARGPVALEADNANLVGGTIGGGAQDLMQQLARPVFSTRPYATPVRGLYLCSSSTPPGGGVHGMCGYHAANAVLNR